MTEETDGGEVSVPQHTGGERFEFVDADVDGHGLHPAFRGARWENIRDAIHTRPGDADLPTG
ncbi:hypothetical protein [Saccharomonospora iraqiensis]|uniref:hypothetical protein n=1 Tax=Saccharomonospora iraqiensis TaxID=52698 RepID=UPI00022E18F1|nr:hypothetical protein [Saccharomonospora iraqiensis]